MTNRERMLTAYRRGRPDRVPVSPELWYDMGVLLDPECDWRELCRGNYPLWRVQRAAHRHFGSAAWLLAAPGGGSVAGDIARREETSAAGDLDLVYTGRTGRRTLGWRVRNNRTYYDWMVEHPLKDLPAELDAFAALFCPPADSLDLAEIDRAVTGVGDEGIVTAYVGSLFFSFIAYHLEGGASAAIFAFVDHEPLLAAFHERYVARLARVAERVAAETAAQILMLENGFSTSGIISPAMYERWDLPVVRAVAEAAHRHGKLLHLHQHGKCLALMDLIAASGADLVEPFERPLSGDTPDLGLIKRRYGDRIAIRGNLHAHDTLLRGTPADVERECRECLAAAGPDGFILASGDGVIVGTPFENIVRMVEAGGP
jgi:hypothetical protein